MCSTIQDIVLGYILMFLYSSPFSVLIFLIRYKYYNFRQPPVPYTIGAALVGKDGKWIQTHPNATAYFLVELGGGIIQKRKKQEGREEEEVTKQKNNNTNLDCRK